MPEVVGYTTVSIQMEGDSMLDIQVISVSPTEAKPGDTVTVRYKLTNKSSEPECYKVNVWWRGEQIGGDTVGTIWEYGTLTLDKSFTMPDKPENPTKFSINVYRGTGVEGSGKPPYCHEFHSAPDDFEVFEVRKITPPPPTPPKAEIDKAYSALYINGEWKSPGTYEISKGTEVWYRARAKNIGGRGAIYISIEDTRSGKVIDEYHDEREAGEYVGISGSFIIESDMDIQFYAGHWDGKDWVEDDKYG